MKTSPNLEPCNDGVLIQRIEPKEGTIHLTDSPLDGNKPIFREGVILSTGPGKWIPGEWWCVRFDEVSMRDPRTGLRFNKPLYKWKWFDGHRQPMEVKPGMRVIFNARWNDLAHSELKGTGCDLKGPLARPLNIRFDPTVHLVQEDDIAGILA